LAMDTAGFTFNVDGSHALGQRDQWFECLPTPSAGSSLVALSTSAHRRSWLA
jgi:hypothetical protein